MVYIRNKHDFLLMKTRLEKTQNNHFWGRQQLFCFFESTLVYESLVAASHSELAILCEAKTEIKTSLDFVVVLKTSLDKVLVHLQLFCQFSFSLVGNQLDLNEWGQWRSPSWCCFRFWTSCLFLSVPSLWVCIWLCISCLCCFPSTYCLSDMRHLTDLIVRLLSAC